MTDNVALMMEALGNSRREFVSAPQDCYSNQDRELGIGETAAAVRRHFVQTAGDDPRSQILAAWNNQATFGSDEVAEQLDQTMLGQGHRQALVRKLHAGNGYDQRKETRQKQYGEERDLYLTERAARGSGNYNTSRPSSGPQRSDCIPTPVSHSTPRSIAGRSGPSGRNRERAPLARPATNRNRALSPRAASRVLFNNGQRVGGPLAAAPANPARTPSNNKTPTISTATPAVRQVSSRDSNVNGNPGRRAAPKAQAGTNATARAARAPQPTNGWTTFSSAASSCGVAGRATAPTTSSTASSAGDSVTRGRRPVPAAPAPTRPAAINPSTRHPLASGVARPAPVDNNVAPCAVTPIGSSSLVDGVQGTPAAVAAPRSRIRTTILTQRPTVHIPALPASLTTSQAQAAATAMASVDSHTKAGMAGLEARLQILQTSDPANMPAASLPLSTPTTNARLRASMDDLMTSTSRSREIQAPASPVMTTTSLQPPVSVQSTAVSAGRRLADAMVRPRVRHAARMASPSTTAALTAVEPRSNEAQTAQWTSPIRPVPYPRAHALQAQAVATMKELTQIAPAPIDPMPTANLPTPTVAPGAWLNAVITSSTGAALNSARQLIASLFGTTIQQDPMSPQALADMTESLARQLQQHARGL